MHDLYHNIAVFHALDPQVSTTTKTSAAIDLQGYGSALVLFSIGATGDTLSGSIYWTLKLQDSDNNSDYDDVTTSGLLNSAATLVIDSNSEDQVTHGFGYVGGKRYVKAVATPTGSHSSGTPIGIVALKGSPALAPVV